jgi:hypothetical protein
MSPRLVLRRDMGGTAGRVPLATLRRQVMELGTEGLGMLQAEVLMRVYADTGAPLSELGREQLLALLRDWRQVARGGTLAVRRRPSRMQGEED